MKGNFQEIKENIMLFLKSYIKNSFSKGFVLGLSGGLDSALVATLCATLSPKDTHAILMPTKFSNESNLKDALELCEKLKINYKIINLDQILNSYISTLNENLENLRYGNLTARIRMNLLYDYSAKTKTIVVGTSNKSELMLGYGTVFGDLAYAINPIGDLYKTEIFEFAKFLDIDGKFITKEPSADLWEDQTDEKDLGYTYKTIDEVLRYIEKFGENLEILEQNFTDKKMVNFVLNRVQDNKFKRQVPKIALL